MEFYARPGDVVATTFDGAPTGLTGTIGIQVLNASTGAVVQARRTTGITELAAGSGVYGTTVTAPAAEGDYSLLWDTGTISPTTVGTDSLIVNGAGAPVTAPAGSIISLAAYREATGDTTTGDDKLNDAIARASVAARSFTGRSFGLATSTGTKTYRYNRSGWLDIDDVTNVTAVVLDNMTLTIDREFVLGPDRGFLTPDSPTVFFWLELPGGLGMSPEMGFMWNLDKLWWRAAPYSTVAVTGTFGWPSVPADVEQAVIWAVEDWTQRGADLESETLSDYSYSRSAVASLEALPARSQELLANYRRTIG